MRICRVQPRPLADTAAKTTSLQTSRVYLLGSCHCTYLKPIPPSGWGYSGPSPFYEEQLLRNIIPGNPTAGVALQSDTTTPPKSQCMVALTLPRVNDSTGGGIAASRAPLSHTNLSTEPCEMGSLSPQSSAPPQVFVFLYFGVRSSSLLFPTLIRQVLGAFQSDLQPFRTWQHFPGEL